MSMVLNVLKGARRGGWSGSGGTAVRPSAVRDALRPLHMATLGQLAAELAAPRSEVEAALLFWVHRGSVRKTRSLELSGCGGGCGTGCESAKPATVTADARRVKRLKRKATAEAGRKPAGIVILYEWVAD